MTRPTVIRTASPQVSVLLPVYNAEDYLEECLVSLRQQTWTDFEVVAVDDGSTDRSALILEQWAATDPRIRILRRPHQGLIEALNHGLAACGGELVARMDADDISLSQRLELQVEAIRGPGGPDVVSCLVTHFPDESVGKGFRIYEAWLNGLVTHEQIVTERFVESPLPHPSVMATKKVLTEVGGYRDMGWPEDYDLWLRLAAMGCRFGKVESVLLKWRQHDERLTRSDSRYAVERFLECKAHHLVEGPLQDVERVVIWGAGQTGRRISKHLLRRGTPIAAFIDIDPKKIGGSLRRLPVIGSESLPALLEGPETTIVLASVSSRGARKIIRGHLGDLGLREGLDFWCVA